MLKHIFKTMSRSLHKRVFLNATLQTTVFPSPTIKELPFDQNYTPQFIALFPLLSFAYCVEFEFDNVGTNTSEQAGSVA